MTDQDIRTMWRGAFDFAYHHHDPRLAGEFSAWVVEAEHDAPDLASVPSYRSLWSVWEDSCGTSQRERPLLL